MTLPSSYDRAALAIYLHSTLGSLAGVLGWEVDSSYENSIDDALLALGITDPEQAEDIELLRLVARRELWAGVRDATAGHYDLRTADNEDLRRSQIHSQAVENHKRLSAQVESAMNRVSVHIYEIDRRPDPYRNPRRRTRTAWWQP